MNSFGKVLVVFITAASVSFAAFAMSLVSGGTNWEGDANSAELTDDMIIAVTQGEKPSYAVKVRKTQETVGSSTNLLADAVIAARTRQLNDAKQELQRLTQEIEKANTESASRKALIPVDEAAMKARTALYDSQLNKISSDLGAVTTDFTSKGGEIQQIQRLNLERRDEALRRKNELELLRNDLFAARGQQKALEDELLRAEENLRRLKNRESQLLDQLGQNQTASSAKARKISTKNAADGRSGSNKK